ncbi:MAG: C40 family peptidase [Clostridiales bacterium]|nr:C40 family peptidase [Clostridiales bacterium]
MKSSNGTSANQAPRKRFNVARLLLRGVSLLLGAVFITALIPFLSAGKTVDIDLQVPAVNEPFATDYLSVSSLDHMGARYDEPELVPEDVMLEYLSDVGEPEPDVEPDLLLENNTFVITEINNEQGIPEELLALSEFELDNTVVYVSANEANIRSEPSGSAEVIGKVHYSDRIQRVGIGSSWSRIQSDEVSEGYILSSLITTTFIATPTPTPTPSPTPTPKPKITERSASGTYYAKGTVNVRSGPGTSYTLLKSLSAGDPVEVVAKTSNGWFKSIKGTYVLASLVTSTKPGSGGTSTGGTPAVTPVSPSGTDLATYAKSLIGVPYVFAGMSLSGMDCSGYVGYVYANYYHITLNRSSYDIAKQGTPVSESEIKVGDVICYDYDGNGVVDHVALYIGGGMIVHASSRNGKVVLAYFSMRSVTTIRRFV